MKKIAYRIIAIVSILLIVANVVSYASINEIQELHEKINSEVNKDDIDEEKQNSETAKENDVEINSEKIIENEEIKNNEETETIIKENEEKIIEDGQQDFEIQNNTENSIKNVGTEKVESIDKEENIEEQKSTNIEDGIYTIESAMASNMVLDVAGGSNSNNANIQIWSNAFVKQQRFKIYNLGDGFYKIIALHSNMSLDVEKYGKNDGTNVQQYTYSGNDAQKWIIQDTGDGYFYIIGKCNGLYLDIKNNSIQNGSNVCMMTKNDSLSQKFKLIKMNLNNQEKLESIENGKYIIRSALNNKMVLDIAGASKNNCANLQIWNDSTCNQQRFEIKYENGFYSIKSSHSGKSLDTQNYGIANSTNVQQYTYSGNDAQKWIIEEAGDNAYYIRSKYNGLYLDVKSGSANNGTNIQLYTGNKSKAQKFIFEKMNIPNQDSINLENGKYVIRSALNDAKVLDVAKASKDNGANIQLYDSMHVIQQQFIITKEKDFYSIKSAHSGKSLDSENYGLLKGTNVQQYAYSGNDAQKWIIQDAGDGYYYIVSKNSGLYLDIKSASTNNGTNIQLYTGNKTNAQKFKFDKVENYVGTQSVEDGTYRIRSCINNNYVLDVAGGSTDNNANIQLWTNSNVMQQEYNIRYMESGYYSIISVNSGKALDTQKCGTMNGTNVQQYNFGNNDAQKWIIQKQEDGTYCIISKCSNLFLDIKGSKASNSANVFLWEKKDNNSQKFILEKINDKSERIIKDGVYEIASISNSKIVADVDNGSKDNGANIRLWQKNNTKAQKFQIYYERGYYVIKNQNSEKVFTTNEKNIVQNEYNEEDNQKWVIKSDGNGGFNIVSLTTGLYMEANKSISSGSNLQVNKKGTQKLQSFKFNKGVITIVLNPGHGGDLSGCANAQLGIYERDVTVKIAKYLRDELNKYSNFNVILTHEGNLVQEMTLAERAEVARRNNADLYVSLHINDEWSHNAKGSMVFVPYYEGQKHYNSSMSRLGTLIQDYLLKLGISKHSTTPITKRCNDTSARYQYIENGVVVQADYYADIRCAMKGSTLGYGDDLNKETGVPAILVEHCFMNNSDVNFIKNDAAIKKVAQADANAILKFFEVK